MHLTRQSVLAALRSLSLSLSLNADHFFTFDLLSSFPSPAVEKSEEWWEDHWQGEKLTQAVYLSIFAMKKVGNLSQSRQTVCTSTPTTTATLKSIQAGQNVGMKGKSTTDISNILDNTEKRVRESWSIKDLEKFYRSNIIVWQKYELEW